MVIVQNERTKICLNKAIYIGTTVLDLSKYLMYDFYYNVLKASPTLNPSLIYMDTDSFIVEINSENPHLELANYLDLSNLGKTYPFQPDLEIPIEIKNKNKGVLGMFKDECAGDIISSVIALRSKMYTIKFCGETPDLKKAKGIARNTVKKYINFDDYEKILFADKTDPNVIQYEMRHEMKTIRSIDHEVKLLSINKVSISAFDDKRYIQDDGISSLPFGHFKIS